MLPQIEPWIDHEELDQLKEVITSTWITENGKTEEFEKKIKLLTGAKYALAVSNGTIGLFMCQKVLGIGPGDEVIVPDLTFIATLSSVTLAGAKPIIVDIDRDTFNILPSAIEAAITPRTKAIMPVHLYAQGADMDEIMKIARKHKLAVIEDAAQGVGVYFNDKHVGTFGELGVLSFYGNKTVTCGEGGMILTNDEAIYKKCWMLKNHGRLVKGTFQHEEIGFNFCLTDLQSAVGVAQMNKLPRILSMKKHINEKYKELLKDVPAVKFVHDDPRSKNAYWFTSILIEDVQGLIEHLKKNKIQTRRFFYPMHMQKPYSNATGEFSNSTWAYEHGLSLPSTATLKDSQIEMVCEKIREFYPN